MRALEPEALFHVKPLGKPMRTCSTCKQSHDNKGAYCRPCRRAYMRTWRAKPKQKRWRGTKLILRPRAAQGD